MALRERDTEIAEEVIADDARVDALDEAVQEQTVKLLALRQPMAVDLRVILSSIKIAAALERIADYAKNTAKRSIVLTNVTAPPSAVTGIDRLGRLVRTALKDVLDAFAHERCRQGARRLAARRGDRPGLHRPVPRAPDLHDGRSAHHHRVHASSVHGQEHRARRRPRHQHRRAGELPHHRPRLRRSPAQGQRLALCRDGTAS